MGSQPRARRTHIVVAGPRGRLQGGLLPHLRGATSLQRDRCVLCGRVTWGQRKRGLPGSSVPGAPTLCAWAGPAGRHGGLPRTLRSSLSKRLAGGVQDMSWRERVREEREPLQKGKWGNRDQGDTRSRRDEGLGNWAGAPLLFSFPSTCEGQWDVLQRPLWQ